MRALIISHEAGTKSGFVGDRLTERGIECHTHVMVPVTSQPDRFQPLPAEKFELLVVMGSYWSVNEDAISAWIGDELEYIRAAHEEGTPVLGICFGGQALAAALGGKVEPSPQTEIGWYSITPAQGVDLPVSTGPWMQWHHDRFTLPPSAKLLASTEACPQLFQLGHSVGTQFHPEVNEEVVTDWLTEATEEYLDSCGVDRDTLLAEVGHHQSQNQQNCHNLVDWFLREASG